MYQIAFLLILLFRKLIEKGGADYNQVLTIVKYKIMMDNRKSITPQHQKKERSNTSWYQLFIYLFFGGMFGMLIGTNPSVSTAMFATFTFLMLMLSMNMVAEFSTLLLDTRDNTIIIPRPVTERTFLLSRLFHISSYILTTSIAFSIIPFIVTSIKFNGLTGLVFFIEVLLSSLLSVFITHIFYLSLMKYTSGERFKDIISYFQTAMTIILFGGYQLLPKFLQHLEIKNITNWWMLLAPPSWMAGATEYCTTFRLTGLNVISILLSVAVPLLGIWLVVKFLAPGYSRKLVMLEQGDIKADKKEIQQTRKSISSHIASLVTRTPSENASFQTIWKITGRDRDYKQFIFSQIGFIFIMLFVVVFQHIKSTGDLANSQKFLFPIYVPFFFLYYLIFSLKGSDNFRSAWVYAVAPIDNPGEIIIGSYKAMIIKFFVPLYAVCNIATLYFWGSGYITQVITGFFLNLVALLTLMSIFKGSLPFSQEKKTANSGRNVAFAFLLYLVSFGLAGIHYLLILLKVNMFIPMFVTIIACWFLFLAIRKKGWTQIEALQI
jgi:ABC-2 type transport system permease protein